MPLRKFMSEYWQKQPLLVRGTMLSAVESCASLGPDELAGLACEEGVESRIVRERGGSQPWEVTWGPYRESYFAELPERGWTLLVQEVNRHVPEVAQILESFTFLPSVRVDDIMVSYAPPGGSVGPHLDSYDVFLVQGAGERRWRYGTTPATSHAFRKGLELRILERFAFDEDVVLGPGDMLYLPPGFAHHGVAVTPCVTYSVGFRAPSLGEMWASFATSAATKVGGRGATLLVDPPLKPAANPGAIPQALLAKVRAAIRAVDTRDETVDRWFASFATSLTPGHPLAPPRRKSSRSKIDARLTRGDTVVRSEEGRWAFLPRPSAGGLFLYVAGEEFAIDASSASLARMLCASRRWDGRDLVSQAKSDAARALIVRLFDLGGLAFAGRASAPVAQRR